MIKFKLLVLTVWVFFFSNCSWAQSIDASSTPIAISEVTIVDVMLLEHSTFDSMLEKVKNNVTDYKNRTGEAIR